MPNTIRIVLEGGSDPPVELILARCGAEPEEGTESRSIPSVRSNLDYVIRVSDDRILQARNLRLYVNDVLRPCYVSGNLIRLADTDGSGANLLDGVFGRARISIAAEMPDTTVVEYESPYVQVDVSAEEAETAAMERMAHFVYEHRGDLFGYGERASSVEAALGEGGRSSAEGRLQLARAIAEEFTTDYPFFASNSPYQMQKTPVVMDFARLNGITSGAVRYIATHPEHMRRVDHSPIHVQHQFYMPEKTLVLESTQSFDTYENRVIVGFLYILKRDMERLGAQCEYALQSAATAAGSQSGMVFPGQRLLSLPAPTLQRMHREIQDLQRQFTRLIGLYERALQVRPEEHALTPRPTNVFLRVPQYARIFKLINKWNTEGVRLFEDRQFETAIAKTPEIYEWYVLAKMLRYFMDHGWSLQQTEEIATRTPGRGDIIRYGLNYTLTKRARVLTVYYQPIIPSGLRPRHMGLGLFRNNTAGPSRQSPGDAYWCPDLVLCVMDGEGQKYLIVDAKYMKVRNVIEREIPDLAFKYLFSISASKGSELLGLAVVHGRGEPDPQAHSVYDCVSPQARVWPSAAYAYLTEEEEEAVQYAKLTDLLAPLLEGDM